MKAMVEEAESPLKFWDRAVKHSTYIRNCPNNEPDSNNINRSTTKAFTGILLDIEMWKTWTSKCYFYINQKIIPNGQCHDKWQDLGLVEVF
jgi:hypothetical protein